MGLLDEELDLKANTNDLEGMTIEQVAERLCDGSIDMDVCDTDIDMMVAFCYDIGDSGDAYERFLGLLAKKVKVVTIRDYVWVCDFSGYFKQFNDELIKLRDSNGWGTIEFDGDETYYDYVLWLEALISGNASESSYSKLLTVLK